MLRPSARPKELHGFNGRERELTLGPFESGKVGRLRLVGLRCQFSTNHGPPTYASETYPLRPVGESFHRVGG